MTTFERERLRMVHEQLLGRGITDERVIAAFRKVPRHLFVPKELQDEAYADHPLPIGSGQTISQPYIVALMTQLLRLQGHERVLEIGAGSGYQTAILAELALEVFSVERLPELTRTLADRLTHLGYFNVRVTSGNGSLGWPEHAPYDGIIVTAAAPHIPAPLAAQLAEGGRMALPIGPHHAQVLIAAEKRTGTLHTKEITSCVFVPLIGDHGWPEQP
jgi:protein-L-isoaspartate(D-aspartate) O-methyltransferase